MKYFSFDYTGNKGSAQVLIAAEGIASAYNRAMNFVEDMLIPHLGPSEEAISVFGVSKEEYWYQMSHDENRYGKPYFIVA